MTNAKKAELSSTLFDAIDYGIVSVSPEGIIEACNERFGEITGYKPFELIGTNGFFLFKKASNLKKHKARIEDRKLGKIEKYSCEIIRKDNTSVWISVNAKPRFNDVEEFLGTISFIEDVTDRYFYEILDEIIQKASKLAINNKLNLWNFIDGLRKVIGQYINTDCFYLAYQLTGRSIWFPYIRDDSNDINKDVYRTAGNGLTEFILKTGDSVLLNENNLEPYLIKNSIDHCGEKAKSWLGVPIYNNEKIIGVICCQSYKNPLEYDVNSKLLLSLVGKKIGVYIEKIKSDIDKERFFDLSGVAVISINKDGFYEYVNSTFSNSLGYPEKELLNNHVLTFMHNADKEKLTLALKALEEGNPLIDLEHRVITKDGKTKWFSWRAYPEENGQSYYCVGREITDQKILELNSKRVEERMLKIIEDLNDGVFFCDSTGKITLVNVKFCKMLGYSKDELIGKNGIQMLHPVEYHQKIKENFEKRKSGETERYDVPFLKKNGEELWVRLNVNLEINDSGEFVGVMGTLSDITQERLEKIKQDRLLILHRSFHELNQSVTRGYNLEQILHTFLKILYSTYNINVSRIYEVVRDENEDKLAIVVEKLKTKSIKKLSEIFPNGIKNIVPRILPGTIYREVMDSFEPVVLIGKKQILKEFTQNTDDPSVDLYKIILNHMIIESYTLFPVIHFNETIYLIECVSEKTISTGEIDDLMTFLNHFSTIVDRKKSDMALQANEQKWRGLIENSSEITCILNANGTIKFMSQSVLRLMGYNNQKIYGKNIFEFIHEDDKKIAYDGFINRIEQGGVGEYSIYRFKHKNGSIKYFRVITACHLDKQEINGIIVNAQDVTELIYAETEKYLEVIQTEENERKRLSRDLHDGVGQYLAATNMYFNLLESYAENQLDFKAKEIFQISKDLLTKATNETRAVSHNIMPPSLKDFGFVQCVNGLIKDLNHENLDIHFNFNKNTDEIYFSEAIGLALFRSIQQLINNSISHGKAKEINVSIHRFDNKITITVEDNGTGFDPDTVKRNEGIGLLSIRQRINSIGGDLSIWSEPGKGCRTEINLNSNYEVINS